ncbi:MAG TPA: rod shape-determining protein RodA [Gammaproteobacteria bacterium]|nr:rod shape-determining protein RodA [Gammaproteobacteria bacterium]
MIFSEGYQYEKRRPLTRAARLLRNLHIDGPLLAGLLAVSGLGLIVLYSASGASRDMLVQQAVRLGVALLALLIAAQFPPKLLRTWTPWGYLFGLGLLALVLLVGDPVMGAQRWLDLGVISFQPSEVMKLGVPMGCAWFLHERRLPPHTGHLLTLAVVILLPTWLIAQQPDLGTSLLVASSGAFVVLLAGLRIRAMLLIGALAVGLAPVLWHFMHEYQRQRVLTFFDPESDPLGAGYHIIQSKIAIGSGGVFGKGWLNGSQAHLEFLPESQTDFIFAVLGEEFGLMGLLVLLVLYLFVIGRGLFMAVQAQDTFSRLVAGSLSLTFFVFVFVNIGMVTGILPVVGVPLPLVSYGGTSMVTLMAGFGILMSIHTHRKLLPT